MSIAEAILWSVACLCVTFIIYRGIECLRANTAAGFRASDRSRRDELQQIERLIEKFQWKDDPRIVTQHAAERNGHITADAAVEKAASETPVIERRNEPLVSTDPSYGNDTPFL